MPADLTTLAAAKVWLGIPSANTTDDALLAQLITAYSAFVRSWTNRDFTVGTYTDTLSGRGGSYLMLPNYPVTSISSLSIGGVAYTPQAIFGGYGYRFDPNGITLDGDSFAAGNSNITVTYTAGYATIPADVAQAVNELVGLKCKEKDRIGYASKTLAQETVSFITKDMPATVLTVLKQYRRTR